MLSLLADTWRLQIQCHKYHWMFFHQTIQWKELTWVQSRPRGIRRRNQGHRRGRLMTHSEEECQSLLLLWDYLARDETISNGVSVYKNRRFTPTHPSSKIESWVKPCLNGFKTVSVFDWHSFDQRPTNGWQRSGSQKKGGGGGGRVPGAPEFLLWSPQPREFRYLEPWIFDHSEAWNAKWNFVVPLSPDIFVLEPWSPAYFRPEPWSPKPLSDHEKLNKSWKKCSNGNSTRPKGNTLWKRPTVWSNWDLIRIPFDKLSTFFIAFKKVADLFKRTQHSFDKFF